MEPHADPLSAQSGHPVYRHRKVLTTWPAPRSWQRKGGTQDGWAYDPRLAAKNCSSREGKWPRDLEHAAPQHLVPRTSGESQSEGSAETLGSLNEQEERSSAEQSGEQQTRAPHVGLQKEHHTAGFNQSEPPPLLLCSARVLEGSCNQRSVSSFTFFLCCCYFSTDSSLCGAWRGRGGAHIQLL